jgi:DNA-binding PadR family transcriptional regulator
MATTQPTGATGDDLTRFRWDILRTLAREGPQYGLAIKRRLEARYGEEVNHGRLYPNLNDLVEAGLVEKGEIDKRTNEYALTDAGKQAVQQRAESWAYAHQALEGSE